MTDASTVCKLDASSTVAFELESDHAQSERSHIIMQNFARVIWNCLKQYNSKLKVMRKKVYCSNQMLFLWLAIYLFSRVLESGIDRLSMYLHMINYFVHNQVAELEIQSLKESIGDEKKKSLELETQLNEFKACCTCSKGGIEKTDTEDSSSVATPQLHNLDREVEYYIPWFLLSFVKSIHISVDAT